MIGHEHISVNGAPVYFRGIEEEIRKSNVVLRRGKDHLAVIAALNRMQRLAFDEEAREAGHDWVDGMPGCRQEMVSDPDDPDDPDADDPDV